VALNIERLLSMSNVISSAVLHILMHDNKTTRSHARTHTVLDHDFACYILFARSFHLICFVIPCLPSNAIGNTTWSSDASRYGLSPTTSEDVLALEVFSEQSLYSYTSNAAADDCPEPRVLDLLCAWPKAVLILAVLLELLELGRVRGAVAASLRGFGALVTAHIAKVQVVGRWAEEGERMKHTASVEHDGERAVDEGVTKVAAVC
jgi:hypothetical protein